MSLDDNLRDRFATHTPAVDDLDQGATDAAHSARRRTTAVRTLGACALFAIVGLGAFTIANRAGETELETASPEPDTTEAATTAAPSDQDTAPLDQAESDSDEASETTVLEPAPINDNAQVFRIANVDANDTLNARAGAGVEFDVLFEFAHNATGVVRTSADPVAVDGSEWVEVFAPTSGTEFAHAWVNSAFLSPTEVPDAVSCLFNGPQDQYIGIDWANTNGDPNAASAVVSNIDTYRFGGCIRTVIEFSTGWSYEDGPIENSTTLATDIVVRRSAEDVLLTEPGPIIDFGASVIGAEAAEERFAENPGVSHSTFMYLGADQTIDGLLFGPTSVIDVRYDNVNGRIIIDTADIDRPTNPSPELEERLGGSSPIIDDKGLVVTKVAPSQDQQQWTFAGLGRPFEATLGATVEANGSPLVVEWTNGLLTEPSAENGFMTSTWTEAWGLFEFSIMIPAGVDPSDVVVIIDPVGALDVPDTVDIALADYAG